MAYLELWMWNQVAEPQTKWTVNIPYDHELPLRRLTQYIQHLESSWFSYWSGKFLLPIRPSNFLCKPQERVTLWKLLVYVMLLGFASLPLGMLTWIRKIKTCRRQFVWENYHKLWGAGDMKACISTMHPGAVSASVPAAGGVPTPKSALSGDYG